MHNQPITKSTITIQSFFVTYQPFHKLTGIQYKLYSIKSFKNLGELLHRDLNLLGNAPLNTLAPPFPKIILGIVE